MMKTLQHIVTVAVLLLSAACGAYAQNVYLSTDKSCYVAGDMIWCSAFCSGGNSVAYVELRSTDGMVQSARIALDNGRGCGFLQIPFSAPTGNYKLLAYTEGADPESGAATVSVFNTLTSERVKDGVEPVADADYAASTGYIPVAQGLSVETGKTVKLTNTSGSRVSVCLSVFCDDGLAAPEDRLIGKEFSGKMHSAASEGTEVDEGEILRLKLVGPDAAKIAGDPAAVAIVSVPGLKTDIYAAHVPASGEVELRTGNVFGDRDIVCMLYGIDDNADSHLEPVSPFAMKEITDVKPLRICRSMEPALRQRTLSMQGEKRGITDTLYTTLPTRREHFFLERECRSYILDDYDRFPTMEEEFVEILKGVRARKMKGGNWAVSVLLSDDVRNSKPLWGFTLVMMDGVPLFDHNQIMNYDPSMVKRVDIYPYTYKLGEITYGGAINFVTYKGTMPGISFDDNVRIYDFKGACYPLSYRGAETLVWEPLLNLEPGQTVEFDCSGARNGQTYDVKAEGVASDGSCVFARKSFKGVSSF